MPKSLFIAEKPSVAREFARALGEQMKSGDGFMESESYVVTWCVGHLVRLSYPDAYDPSLKVWRLDTLPFIPDEFKYEIIPSASKQFKIISKQLRRRDVDVIYVCTDSGREGEYIYRLVDQMVGVSGKEKRRVWIDSQTEEEILRGIREAKDLSEYDDLAASAYLRAKEDYLMGINFSRILSLKYGSLVKSLLGLQKSSIAVGRVMTCVLGMVVRREREIRDFVSTPFYRISANMTSDGESLSGDWKAVQGSKYFGSPLLYKDTGFLKEDDAKACVDTLKCVTPQEAEVIKATKKNENKRAPLLYNLAELQNDCSKMFHISPDETLSIVQSLYEKKLVTYPRTDARVLSSAVAKVIASNLSGLSRMNVLPHIAAEILHKGTYKGIAKSRYVDDSKITDHYAIIPTGQGQGAFSSLKPLESKVYEAIVRRFLSIFLPPAVYVKAEIEAVIGDEHFFLSTRVLKDAGYLAAARPDGGMSKKNLNNEDESEKADSDLGGKQSAGFEVISKIKKGTRLPVLGYEIKPGETKPPKRYTSGSMILAMENAGQLIEDEELREQIKGSGIGTSATRAEILKKLINNKYLSLYKKYQTIFPTLQGEMIYEVVNISIKSLLNPDLTASWEKGLSYVAEGKVGSDEYMEKLSAFVTKHVNDVKSKSGADYIKKLYLKDREYYKKK